MRYALARSAFVRSPSAPADEAVPASDAVPAVDASPVTFEPADAPSGDVGEPPRETVVEQAQPQVFTTPSELPEDVEPVAGEAEAVQEPDSATASQISDPPAPAPTARPPATPVPAIAGDSPTAEVLTEPAIASEREATATPPPAAPAAVVATSDSADGEEAAPTRTDVDTGAPEPVESSTGVETPPSVEPAPLQESAATETGVVTPAPVDTSALPVDSAGQVDFQSFAPMSEPGNLGFGSALDKILQEPTSEPSQESDESTAVADGSSQTASSQFVFPTSDPLSERKDAEKEEVQESTAPKALSDTVEKDYKNLVDMAEQIFEAANTGSEPDSASVIDAIWRTLEQLRKNDELLEESVRQRRDYHSWSQRGANVAVLSIRLGVEVECDERRCLALGLCGLMHDLGMLTITKDVLDSPRFNASQLKQLRGHPLESQKMIETFGESFAWVGKIVAQAHERQDGGGYPRGIKGNQIHEVARILGLADTYEAMSHPRPDRKARATYDALKEIVDQRNHQFDRRIIKALISIVSIFPLGSLVQLSNGEVGRVVRVSKNFPTRPSVEIILDPQGRAVNHTRFVVLENEPLLTIVDPAIPEDVLQR